MNIRAILKVTSPVFIVLGLAMLACIGISLLYKENPWPLAYGGLASTLIGCLLFWESRTANVDDLTIREACTIVTLSWVFACAFGAIPLYTMGWFDSALATTWTKSYYEIMSGFTTTGSTIYSNVEILPKGILFWRSLTHWFGGMGIIVFAIAILPKLGIGGMKAFRMESPGPLKTDKLVPRISQTAKILYTVYLAITVIEIVCLLMVGVNWFDAVLHTFGTVGTGGFSNYNASVAGLQNVAAEYIIAFFMWLSGVNFGLLYLAFWKRIWSALFKDTEFRVYTAITVLCIAAITGVLYAYDWALSQAFRYAFFQIPTVMTTTGYATYDYNGWPVAAVIFIVLVMFIGASTGSTGGGLKVLRYVINAKFIKHELLKIVRPNLVTTVKVNDRPITTEIVNSVAALTSLYLFVFFLGGFILCLLNVDLITAFTASIANLGNIGPGLNIVGPAGNYSTIPPLGLWTLTTEMLLGRLEIYTVLAIFAPTLWSKKV